MTCVCVLVITATDMHQAANSVTSSQNWVNVEECYCSTCVSVRVNFCLHRAFAQVLRRRTPRRGRASRPARRVPSRRALQRVEIQHAYVLCACVRVCAVSVCVRAHVRVCVRACVCSLCVRVCVCDSRFSVFALFDALFYISLV